MHSEVYTRSICSSKQRFPFVNTRENQAKILTFAIRFYFHSPAEHGVKHGVPTKESSDGCVKKCTAYIQLYIAVHAVT